MYKNVFQTGSCVLSSRVVLYQKKPQFCLDTTLMVMFLLLANFYLCVYILCSKSCRFMSTRNTDLLVLNGPLTGSIVKCIT